jgi:hypothetical protein
MPSAAEDIVQEIEAMLKLPPMVSVPAARVHRDLMEAIRSEAFPAIAIEAGDEPAPVRALLGGADNGRKDRRVEINVTVLAKGSNPFGQADAALLEAFGRIMHDPHLNDRAMDLLEGPTRRQREGLSEDLGAVTKTFIVEYRTAERSLEAL